MKLIGYRKSVGDCKSDQTRRQIGPLWDCKRRSDEHNKRAYELKSHAEPPIASYPRQPGAIVRVNIVQVFLRKIFDAAECPDGRQARNRWRE